VHRERDGVCGALSALSRPPERYEGLTVAVTRVGWSELDPDGLATALKSVQDGVADWLEVNDRDPRLHLRYAQRMTRARRREWYGGQRYHRDVPDGRIIVVVRPWRPEDGTDRLRVLARGQEAV
jgi:hypothetical protein